MEMLLALLIVMLRTEQCRRFWSESISCLQKTASLTPAEPSYYQPASLWDSSLLKWCQQLKQAELDSSDREVNSSNPTSVKETSKAAPTEGGLTAPQKGYSGAEAEVARQPLKENDKDKGTTNLATPSDPFAFDLGAFGVGGNPGPSEDPYAFDPSSFEQPPAAAEAEGEPQSKHQAETDPFTFDPSVFGMGGAPGQQEDAYAFDPSRFEEGPASEIEQKPEGAGTATADPYAFDAGAFVEAAAVPDHAQTEDPFAFNMEAFGDSNALGATTQQPSSQSADPFAFDMSAFGQPGLMPDAEEESRAPKSKAAVKPLIKEQQPFSQSRPEQHTAVDSTAKKSSASKQLSFAKEARIVFHPLTPSDLAALKEVLLPPVHADTPEDQSSSSEVGDEGSKEEKVAGLSREEAQLLLKTAEILASGLPGSIVDNSALDHAAQRAACSLQVG